VEAEKCVVDPLLEDLDNTVQHGSAGRARTSTLRRINTRDRTNRMRIASRIPSGLEDVDCEL
jgi:hypothetical protein